MKRVFVDTSHFVAVLHPSDQLHKKAVAVEANLGSIRLVTTDFIMTEVLNYFSEFREYFKEQIAKAVEAVILANEIEIVECSREQFLDGFNFSRFSTRLHP